jgi:hypothetical protein
MDALVENASQPWVSFKEQDLLEAGAGCTHGNSHSCGSASNDDDIVVVKVQHSQLNPNPPSKVLYTSDYRLQRTDVTSHSTVSPFYGYGFDQNDRADINPQPGVGIALSR